MIMTVCACFSCINGVSLLYLASSTSVIDCALHASQQRLKSLLTQLSPLQHRN